MCPYDKVIDTGPKKVDYYVHIWHEFKNRYHQMFEDPNY